MNPLTESLLFCSDPPRSLVALAVASHHVTDGKSETLEGNILTSAARTQSQSVSNCTERKGNLMSGSVANGSGRGR